MITLNNSFVIQDKQSKEYFSDFNNDLPIFNTSLPWIYNRECDALFVLFQMNWTERCEVIPLSLNTKNEISPDEALALFAESKARKLDVYFRDHVDSDWKAGKLTGIRSHPLPFVGHHAHQPVSAGTTTFRFCAIRRDQECYKYGGICKYGCHGQCKESC